jgi:hypothetical protein
MSTHIDYMGQAKTDSESFFAPDVVTLRFNGGAGYRLYSNNQLRWATPFTADAQGAVRDEYVNRRNSSFEDAGGEVFGGKIFTVGEFFERGDIFGILTRL